MTQTSPYQHRVDELMAQPGAVDLHDLADRIRRRGVPARVDQSGGGCATIYVGEETVDEHGGRRYPVLIGTGGYFGPDLPAPALLADLYVGPEEADDEDLYMTATDDRIDDVVDRAVGLVADALVDGGRVEPLAVDAVEPPGGGYVIHAQADIAVVVDGHGRPVEVRLAPIDPEFIDYARRPDRIGVVYPLHESADALAAEAVDPPADLVALVADDALWHGLATNALPIRWDQ